MKPEDIVSKCIKCGFCESVCPTLPASGFNPIFGARGRVILANNILSGEDINGLDSFYSCLECNACINVCPAGINAGEVSHLMRYNLLKNGFKNDVAELIKNAILEFKNPLGLNRECASWSDGILFDDSDTVLITGDMYQLMPYLKKINFLREYIEKRYESKFSEIIARNLKLIKYSYMFCDKNDKKRYEKILKNIVNLLKRSGYRFSYLRDEEPYPGTFLYDLGYIDEFIDYARHVYSYLRERGFKKIITIDPHTYDIFNKYRKYMDFDMEVYYYTELIEVNNKNKNETVTAHEPCHMVLYNYDFTGVEKLSRIAHVKMPERSGKKLMCCGGPDELLFPEISRNVSRIRFNELNDVSNKIITFCPICLANLSKNENVLDFSEFIYGN
ncbi:(Fe-S)-binding protein [Picrophilus oshimae]|uniref:Glycolate oxidase iron-sulfur subunit n=1 Tax=Picrophilus torridus (strain ATCC 700027 / DSM 9790 / JCM 10055 / NBRC 100828 / KAW 2/3) TaxID=1122961 RepID=A0A8G2L7M7_PICTO|nr:(Fe-S)-binding protein [Picrophilus oshimae]SMD31258.1 glycolate oxidase iron-sulfur subunit [Picrophilus oshimae DSM 9789]